MSTVRPTKKSSLAEFENVFHHFDKNRDGKISPDELRLCLGTFGEELALEEAVAVVESVDSDGDGFLGFDDFVKLVEAKGEEERDEDLRAAFGVYEMKGVGVITPGSLKRALSILGSSRKLLECKNMICRFDLDSDGMLSFEEFRVMMQ